MKIICHEKLEKNCNFVNLQVNLASNSTVKILQSIGERYENSYYIYCRPKEITT